MSAARPPGYTDPSRAPVAQGIERCPAEAEVASSNLAGRMVQCRFALLVASRACGLAGGALAVAVGSVPRHEIWHGG
jgi:hypothetical protein